MPQVLAHMYPSFKYLELWVLRWSIYRSQGTRKGLQWKGKGLKEVIDGMGHGTRNNGGRLTERVVWEGRAELGEGSNKNVWKNSCGNLFHKHIYKINVCIYECVCICTYIYTFTHTHTSNLPESVGRQKASPVPYMECPSLSCPTKAPETLKIIKAIIIVFRCSLELGGKSLLLKASYTLVLRCGEIKFVLTWKWRWNL